MNIDSNILFQYQEIQYYRQRWVLLLLLAASALSWYSFLSQILLTNSINSSSLPNWLVITLFVTFGIGVPVLIYFTRMVTEVRRDSIFIQFLPFTKQTIPFQDITGVESNNNNLFNKIGFWEFSWGTGNPKVYNISGSSGIEITLINDDRILIGSQNPDQLRRIISTNIIRKN